MEYAKTLLAQMDANPQLAEPSVDWDWTKGWPDSVDEPAAETLNDIIEREEREGLEEELAAAKARIAELEAEAPVPLPPNPEEARLSDYGQVGVIPSQIAELMEEGETVAQAKERITKLLWVERAELRQVQGRKGENLKREAEIDFLLGLLARLGDS